MASFDISPPISLNDAVSGRGVSAYDVLNGKGNSINNTTGNANYRRLVSANKDFYASCQENDKKKISMGIVTAVRMFHGRFLAYDDSNMIFRTDIGDEKARYKTSQALRDRKRKKEESSLPVRIDTSHFDWTKELPQEWYTTYSCRVLESFHGINHSNSSMAMPTVDAAHQNESERENSISTFSISLFSDSPPSQVLESFHAPQSERCSSISNLSVGTGFAEDSTRMSSSEA
mmetsp:Transcript_27007/g.41555  ORF Transcript_27007/g.41555 Transcript_27007/m.41555 type:complete len:232 (-) Transcript_27007:158-853(-)